MDTTQVEKVIPRRIYSFREFMGLNNVKTIVIKPSINNNPMVQFGTVVATIKKGMTPNEVIQEAETLIVAEFPDEKYDASYCVMRRGGLKNEILGSFTIE